VGDVFLFIVINLLIKNEQTKLIFLQIQAKINNLY
jgi:hypothetical protein